MTLLRRAALAPPLLASLCLPLLALAPPASAQSLVWLQNSDGYSIVPSAAWSSPSPSDLEAADDFEFAGAVTRVVVHGYKDFSAPPALAIDGVRVRFYADAGGHPGALQYDRFVPEGSSAFVHSPYPTDLDVTLPAPFAASGRHFVSVQLATPAAHGWRWWSANTQAPALAPAHVRDGQVGGGWQVYQTGLGFQSDLAFDLWGDDGAPLPDPVDPCAAWQELDAPALPPNYSTTVLRDLVVIANDDAWAVADPAVEVQFLNYEFKTLALHWDGDDWTVVPTPNPGVMPDPFQSTGLNGVDASGPDDVWAVGDWERQDSLGFLIDQPLVLRWNGGGWQHLVVPNDQQDRHTFDVKVFGPDDVWIVGGGHAPFSAHWDGGGFQNVPVPSFGLPGGTPGFDFTAVDGASSDDLWAVGGGSDGDFSGTTMVARWNGSGWSYVGGPSPGFARRLFDVHVLAPDDVWAVGQYEALVGPVVKFFGFVIHWDGSGWELFDGAQESVGSLSIHAFGPDEVYSAGSFVHRYDGTRWSVADDLGQLPGANVGVALAALDAAAPCTLFAAGRQEVAGALVPFVARQQGPGVWSATPLACPTAPGVPGGIALLSGPKLGTPFTVALGDPQGAAGVTPGATVTFWAIGLVGLGGECGAPLAGAGPGGAAAALFVDPQHLTLLSGPVVWGGFGAPALHSVAVPADPALAGLGVVTQGALLDPTLASGLRLTDGLAATLGE